MAWFEKGKKSLVVVAEDDKELNLLLAQLLEDAGYEVKRAFSGGETMNFIRKDPPDLLLLDIMMPGMDGSEVILKMKSDPKTRDIPVVICTALDGMKDVEKYFKWGAASYIIKPFDPKRVLETVHATLSKNRT